MIRKFIGWIIGWILVIVPSYIIISLIVQSPKRLMDLWNILNLFNKILVIIILVFIGGIGSILTQKFPKNTYKTNKT